MLLDSHGMFTGWVTTMFTLQLNVYTVAISSVNKIVINEWLRLNISGFLMYWLARRIPFLKLLILVPNGVPG